MRGLVEKDMQAVVNSYDLKPYYYPTLFPLKETYTLTWKALETQVGLKIAADLVARGASVDKKTREAIARIQGDIPKIAVKRTKNDEELMLALCAKIDDYNKQLNIPKTLKEFGIDEKEFKEKVSVIAENAVGDACTGSNPRSITPAQMEKLFTAIYYGDKVDF